MQIVSVYREARKKMQKKNQRSAILYHVFNNIAEIIPYNKFYLSEASSNFPLWFYYVVILFRSVLNPENIPRYLRPANENYLARLT